MLKEVYIMQYLPFSFEITPMQKLFLINFEKDPDEIYMALEPQWFDNGVTMVM